MKLKGLVVTVAALVLVVFTMGSANAMQWHKVCVPDDDVTYNVTPSTVTADLIQEIDSDANGEYFAYNIVRATPNDPITLWRSSPGYSSQTTDDFQFNQGGYVRFWFDDQQQSGGTIEFTTTW